MINLTNKEFSEVIVEVSREVNDTDKDMGFLVIVLGAMLGAAAEKRTEEKEAEKKKEGHEAVVEYDAGNWNILIETKKNDNVRLRMKLKGEVICDRILDSLYKAYNYAFNIICC